MRSRRVRSVLVLTTVAIVGAAVWWVSPGGVAQGQQQGCVLDPAAQPPHPLEMNTVFQGGLFKTVVMEKEVFHCFDPAGNLTRIHDVETFIELIERGLLRPVERRVEVATCVKDFAAGRVDCSVKALDLQPANFPPLEGCSPREQMTPSDPVEMNTVAPPSGVIKTIKVEKEVFHCGETIRDLYLVTEIGERKTTIPGTDILTIRPVRKRFEGIVCFKIPGLPTVDRCFRFVPA